MKGILGKKIGMTEVFTKNGKVIPVTVVSVEPNYIMQVKTKTTDGYDAIQLGFIDKKEQRANKAEIGHAKKASAAPKRFLKELRVSDIDKYVVGNAISADIFEVGEKVDVTGTSKGHGFTGVIRRHNQSEGPKTHGSTYHRRPGSMGSMRPKRVLKGKKLSGHMGVDTVTVQNLDIVDINTELNYILVSGNVPGAKNSLILIKSAVKDNKKTNIELATYEETSTVIDEVIEEVDSVIEEVAEPAEITEEQSPVEETIDTTEKVNE